MTKAYSYIRFSTVEQARGDSLRRQLEAARKWSSDRGFELDDTLRDLGRSAYKGGHAQLGALRTFLDLVESGEVEQGSYLIIESLDRLSREAVLDAAARLFDLIRAGVTVVTLSDGQEYSRERLQEDWTPLVVSIAVMARAHDESRVKGLRVGKAWEEKRRLAKEEGQAMTAICPGWIRLVGDPKSGRYELIPERAMIVRRIFEDTIAGLGRRTIAGRLNRNSTPTWGEGRKAGSRWHDSYIQKILNNPAVFGRFEPLGLLAGGDGNPGMVIDRYFPAAIDEQIYYAAQAAISTRRVGIGRPSTKHQNLLRGLAKCGGCGSNLVFVNKGKRSSGPKLICGSAHASSGCDRRTYYPYRFVEPSVIFAVSKKQWPNLIGSIKTQTSAKQSEYDALQARRTVAMSRLTNLIEMVAAGGGGATVAAQVRKLEEEIEEIGAAMKTVEQEIKAAQALTPSIDGHALEEIYQQFRNLDDEDLARRRATVAQKLRSMIDRIVFDDQLVTVHMIGGGTGRLYIGGP
ncbi:MAG: hypothetical protein ABS76_34600 [Pelagibacterium sp. SCN 64-44]|nr:MAG: hypothetical protein ABS76_34600 [Pelagibacterium sp. SCN 64-44]